MVFAPWSGLSSWCGHVASSDVDVLADGPLSSLAYNRESLPRRPERCERKKYLFLVNGATGEFVPLGCSRMTCPSCSRWLAIRTAGAVGLAEPQRLIRFSLVGDDWQTVRARMSRVVYDLRKALPGGVELAWNVEPNPKGTGQHIHALEHGSYIPQPLLAEIADRRGMGRNVDIRKWEAQGPLSSAYGLKGVLYPIKGALGEQEGLDVFLRCNGRRLIHATRGFFRHGALGPHVGLEDARRIWSVVRRGATEPDPWGVRYCPAWEKGISGETA